MNSSVMSRRRMSGPAAASTADLAAPAPLGSLCGLYIHVPFCVRKCFYCDFNSYTVRRNEVLAYLDAIRREIDLYAADPRFAGRRFETVFVGGGTPSVLTGEQLAGIIGHARAAFNLDPAAEITTEANPSSVTPERLAAWRAAGINRLSLGVQSFDDTLLEAIGRVHTAAEVEDAVAAARTAGFDNLNLDLMFALPDQTEAIWAKTLSRALALAPEHISAYSLIVEEGTPFFDWREAGRLSLPGEDAEAAMYETGIARLAKAGLEQYEISNFARPGRPCRHNLLYWRYGEYLGMGPGAHSFWGGVRWANEKLPQAYRQRLELGEAPLAQTEAIPPEEQLDEAMMLGLRLNAGISVPAFQSRFDRDPRAVYGGVLQPLVDAGRLELNAEAIRLTPAGRPLANAVFAAVLRPGDS